MMAMTDPINYPDQLAKVPTYVIIAADDQFMSMDWSNIYYDKLTGENHLLIIPNADHSIKTGEFALLSTFGTYIRSIASGKEERPSFDYQYNNETGDLSVTIPKDSV